MSQATISVSMTKDYDHFLRKGLNTDIDPGLILVNAKVLSRKYFRIIVNDGVKGATQCMPLMTEKMNFYTLLT